MLSQEEIKKLFRTEDLRILKNLGQNFLIDKTVLDKIVSASKLNKNDVVIEIGPGLGTLTKELSARCKKVIAIEKDKKMAEILENRILNMEYGISNIKIPNSIIINDDILKINLDKLLKKHTPDEKYKLVSNIPYYITSPIIKLFLEAETKPEIIILLVQKEVAERICAKPGKLSVLALSVQIYGEPEIVSYVDKSAFYPEPKVDSAILKIKNIKKDTSDYAPKDNYKNLFRIIKIGFSSKRKKLLNNLSAGLCIDKKESEKILSTAGLSLNARAQELRLEDWIKLEKITSLNYRMF
jgi:16S rRNA (adenine1518-N6/adenine1519-N6)-dimethyltransferase